VRQAIEAGVRCIEHGQLLDEPTVELLVEKQIWWSLQTFLDDRPSPFAEGSANRLKQLEMTGGTDKAYRLARKHKAKLAWGTDVLFDPAVAALRGRELAKCVRWFTPAEVLKLGVIQEGALADLLLVDGDPLAEIELVETPAKTFLVIVKDGKIYKNMAA
jgi:imidazolonepropionase-like amidohydrolase